MISLAIPESEQTRIARELRQDEVIRVARNIEDELLEKHREDWRMAVHEMALMVAETRVQ